MSAEKVSYESFGTKVLTSGKPALVCFETSWCGYCKKLRPTIDRLADHAQDRYRVFTVDCEEDGRLKEGYRIRGYPTVLLFVGGLVTDRITGCEAEEVYLEALRRAMHPADTSPA